MAKRAEKGRQKIEMKLIECEKARVFACSKRKIALLEYAEKLSTRTGAEVGVMLFTTGSEIPPNKQMNEQILAIEMQKEQLKKEIRSAILAELLKIDLNVAPDPEEDKSS
ncbi:hypothetical protein BC332_09838 [Capsicum chinense]|nr:hypothetical protein BC332_09838 [Capsicum chinense]